MLIFVRNSINNYCNWSFLKMVNNGGGEGGEILFINMFLLKGYKIIFFIVYNILVFENW